MDIELLGGQAGDKDAGVQNSGSGENGKKSVGDGEKIYPKRKLLKISEGQPHNEDGLFGVDESLFKNSKAKD